MSQEGTDALLALAREINGKLDTLLQHAQGPAQAPRSTGTGAGGGTAGGARFGNYGRSKGQPVAGASLSDLEYYAGGCRRTLADPGKARFHDAERVLLRAIEDEIARTKGQPGAADPSDEWEPFGDPPPDEPAF